MRVFTNSDFGYEGVLVHCDVDIRHGIPAVDMLGFADGAAKELRARIKAAIENSGLEFPMERVIMSFDPADLHKEGARYELPSALAVLDAASQRGDFHDSISVFAAGGLELSGKVKPVSAVFQGASLAKEYGICYAVLPKGNRKETVPCGMKVHYTDNLADAYDAMRSVGTDKENSYFKEQEKMEEEDRITFPDSEDGMSFDKIKGNGFVKYAVAAAAAGKHNIVISGGPGCGKTSLLRRMPEVMPDLFSNEYLQNERIYSAAGLIGAGRKMSRRRPFEMPHQTSTIEGICGGGRNLKPGEMSLANNGVLFLDEAAEFRTSVLQMLYVPVETRSLILARAGRSTAYPADFQLAMAVRPCPCGNFGSKSRLCFCSAKTVELYWKKILLPFKDRLEIMVDMPNADKDFPDITQKELRAKVRRAWKAQLKRGVFNGRLDLKSIENMPLDGEPGNILAGIIKAQKGRWSKRRIANFKCLARTVADMEGHELVRKDDIEMALRLNTGLDYVLGIAC